MACKCVKYAKKKGPGGKRRCLKRRPKGCSPKSKRKKSRRRRRR